MTDVFKLLFFSILGDDNSGFKFSNKLVDHFLLHMLHNNNVRKVASEPFVVAVGKVEFRHYFAIGTLEKHRVAVFVVPAWPAYSGEFRHKVGSVLHDGSSLFCPAFYADGLQQPPEFQRLNTRARTIYHTHIGVEICHVEGCLVVIYFASGDKQSAGAVDTEELVSADGY